MCKRSILSKVSIFKVGLDHFNDPKAFMEYSSDE